MNVVNIENLTKTYGACKAVDNISFSVEKGSLVGFLGVNGAGKSTTINMMSTLLSPESGKIEICGLDTKKNSSEIRKKIGIVYQNNMLDDLLTVKENLICRGILHGSDKKQALYRLKELSNIFNLDDIMKKKYHTLSGGQKRRCEIVSALMHTPEILILDEPTTGLDPATRQDVWNTIEFLRKNKSMTVFLTTHYMEEASKADKIIIISKGKIITQGTPHQLKEKYSSDYMKIYCNDIQKTNIIAKIKNVEYTDENYGIKIILNSTRQTVEFLNIIGTDFSGLEVIQGTMDDVFLNATKGECQI